MSVVRARTPRLSLRDFTMADEPTVVRFFGNADIMRYIGAGGPLGPERARAALARWIGDGTIAGYSLWAIEERDGLPGIAIGWCGLQPLQTSGFVEIGWLLDAPFWGRGYATEAAAAALAYGFERARLRRIVAVAHPENLASINVMRKLGMRDGGRARYYDRDTVFFVLDAGDFRRREGVQTFAVARGGVPPGG